MKSAPYARYKFSTGAAPRPFERRPVPEGRKFRRWRQPQRLFERPQGASSPEGSDRRNFQAVVTGRRFLSLATFHSFLEEMVGNVTDHGIIFQKWKRSYMRDTYGLSMWARTDCEEKFSL